jgi:hypothetical protein
MRNAKIFWKCGGRCYYCGHLLDPEKWQVEHMTPRSQRGQTREQNLVPACRFCNKSKNNRTPAEFKRYKQEQMQKALTRCSEVLRTIEGNVSPEAASELRSILTHASTVVWSLDITFYGERADVVADAYNLTPDTEATEIEREQ